MKFSLIRAVLFFGLWLALTPFSPADIVVGMLAAVLATRASVAVLPPGQWRLRPLMLVRLGVHFLRQSVSAGIDVAWRALDPRLPLQPGFVVYRPQFPPGPARSTFSAITSLMPGTLPCGPDRDGNLLIHCLVASEDVAPQLAAEEALLRQTLGARRRDG